MKRIALLIAVAALNGCGERPATETASTTQAAPAAPAEPAAPPPAAAPAPASTQTLPTVDTTAIQASLAPDDTLEVVDFEAFGTTTREGTVEGNKTKVWAVPVATGQTLTVTFEPSNANFYMNVADAADTSGAAIFIGEQAGTKAEIIAVKDGAYLIKLYRAMAHRNETGSYKLTIERK